MEKSTGALAVIGTVTICVLSALLIGGAGQAGDQYQPERAGWAGWQVIGIGVLVLLGALAVGLVGYALIRLGLSARAAVVASRQSAALAALDLQRAAAQVEAEKTRSTIDAARLRPDLGGRMGGLVRPTAAGWQVVNLDAEAAPLLLGDGGSLDRLLADPLTLAGLQGRHLLEVERARATAHPNLTSYHLHQVGAPSVAGELPAGSTASWPGRVLLRDLIGAGPALDRLALGLTMAGDGQAQTVTAALGELVHIAVGGSSGWGKSVFLRALALQLATAAEPVSLALVDLEGATFAPFAQSDRLLWPVADSEPAALALMAQLVDEMNRRRDLYAAFPGVDSLAAYNARADQPLPPVVALIDEATALLSDRDVHNATRTLALRARKYGLWLVLGGQDWKAASIDTAIRNQLSTRVHFKAQSPSQSRVLLGDGCAAAIETPGRAWAQLPGRPLVELQAPYVTLPEIEAALTGQTGPAQVLPEVAGGDLPTDQAPTLGDLDRALAEYALDNLDGCFTLRPLADAFTDRGLTPDKVKTIRDRLIASGLLTPAAGTREPARVTADLLDLLATDAPAGTVGL